MDRFLRAAHAISWAGLLTCLALLVLVARRDHAPAVDKSFRCFEAWPRGAGEWCRMTRTG